MESEALKGELLYEYTAQFTNITEYGISLAAVLSGHAPIPPSGARFDIAFAAGGVCVPNPGSSDALLSENVRLTTAHADHAWLATREIWAIGRADLAASTVHLRGYLPFERAPKDGL